MKLVGWMFMGVAGAIFASGATLTRDIEYGRAGAAILRLDASVPDGTGPFPVAILVHGGGWSRGDKRGSDVPGNSADITPWFGILDRAGFTWFSINYRMAPANRWPACLEDVQAAIRWVKAHAREYRGDPHRIVLFGHSAAGQIVCLAALEAGDDTRVQGVVGCAPVTDLVQDSVIRGGVSASLQALLKVPRQLTPETRAILRGASPIFHVAAGSPPFLLVQGDADKTVPRALTEAFKARLESAGVPCELITIPGGPHSMMTWERRDSSYPQRLTKWLEAVGRPVPMSSR
jgi:alpha-L-fucosidase 2